MKKKILYITSLVFILLAAASTWSYYCLNPSSDRVNKAKANIKVYSHYELIQNGKTILRFDEDTTTLAANFMNRWALIPSCEGRLAACYNNSTKGLSTPPRIPEAVTRLPAGYCGSEVSVAPRGLTEKPKRQHRTVCADLGAD